MAHNMGLVSGHQIFDATEKLVLGHEGNEFNMGRKMAEISNGYFNSSDNARNVLSLLMRMR